MIDTRNIARALGLLAVFAAAGAPAAAVAAPAPQISDAEVAAAMRRGVDFLMKEKDNKGTWEKGDAAWVKEHVGGKTGLVTYALLHAGESLDDHRLRAKSEELAPTMTYLKDLVPQTTYAAAFQICALTTGRQEGPDIRKTVLRAMAVLAASGRPDGGQGYSPRSRREHPDWWDLSNTQYAVLALWAAQNAGYEVPGVYWEKADRFWRAKQESDGGWPYTKAKHHGDGKVYRPHSNPPMDVAGLASLYVTRDMLPAKLETHPKRDRAMEAALERVIREFKPDSNDYYYLYGVERVGLASGLKFFNDVNWYKAAAAEMIKRQNKDGSWTGRFVDSNIGGEDPAVSTAYALLFLARGRNPVVFNKLQYGGENSRWNARPRDSAMITEWMGKTFEKPINWQVVNAKAPAAEWLDAPILLITGSGEPDFSDTELAHMRAFVEAGGMIFSTADGGDRVFTHSIISKIAPALVDKKYEMRELPEDHAIFSNELWSKVSNPPRLMALSNGVREVWVHSGTDMGASWHLRRYATKDHWTIPANLYFYATGKSSPRTKLESLAVAPADKFAVRSIKVGMLEYNGNWQPEPGAWPRMARLAAHFHTKLAAEKVTFASLDAKTHHVVHMTGTTAFTLNDDQVKQLRAYLDAGGTLIADAAGGSDAFTKSFLQWAKALYPERGLMPIPLNHPIYNGTAEDTVKADAATFRRYVRSGDRTAPTAPRLLGISNPQGRMAVVFSEDDLTHGMLGTDTWGISGYEPVWAQRLLQNMLVTTASGTGRQSGQDKPPATTPADAKP